TTFTNLSSNSLDLRNFADLDGDGVRETEAVSISNFGAGIDTFDNDTAGAVTVLNVAGATTIDLANAYAPTTVDPAFHDITLEGVEQAQLLGLETFRNAGSISMRETALLGQPGVAGDVLVISGSDVAGTSGGGVFQSDGGSLLIDTVLN